MEIVDRKFFWWLVLVSCAGAGLLLVLLVVLSIPANRIKSADIGAALVSLFCLWVESHFAVQAVRKLRECYKEEPVNWARRWQFALSDLLSIVFLIAALMTFFRGIQSDNAFLKSGLPASLLLGISYGLSLIITARREDLPNNAFVRWTVALSWLGAVLIYAALAIIAQGLALSFVFVLTRVILDAMR